MQYSPFSLGEYHKTDFETLMCPGSYYTPHRSRGFLHNPRRFLPKAHRNNDHHPTKPQHQHQSTHQQSLPALTTSSPLKQIRPRPEGSIYTLLCFQEKHTCCHIFPHRMCLNFMFCSALVVIFYYNGDSAKSFNTVIMPVFSFFFFNNKRRERGCSLVLSSH